MCVSVEEKICIDIEVFSELVRAIGELASSIAAIRDRLSKAVTVTITIQRPGAAEAAPGTTAPPVREMVLRVMRPGEVYDVGKIKRLIKDMFNVDVNPYSVRGRLSELCRAGVVVRIDQGVYALRRAKTYPLVPIDSKILEVLEPGKKYSTRDIVEIFRQKGVELKRGTLYGSLTRLARAGKIKRVKRGLYEVAEMAK